MDAEKNIWSASKFTHGKNLSKLEIEMNFLNVLKSHVDIFFPDVETETRTYLLYHILLEVLASNKESN